MFSWEKQIRCIDKVLSVAMVARARFDAYGNCIFDGKIGIFSFTYKESAKRNSKNRVAGTMITKPILSVTKDVYRACLIEKVLPAIPACWPRCVGIAQILIQKDNTKPHIGPTDPEFVAAGGGVGYDIRLKFQPQNSPDLNVLDLGFFRAIRALQHQQAPRTIDDLVHAVEKSFHDLQPTSLDNICLSLQGCMIEVIKVFGGNNYKLLHIGENRLGRSGNLAAQFSCDQENVREALNRRQLP